MQEFIKIFMCSIFILLHDLPINCIHTVFDQVTLITFACARGGQRTFSAYRVDMLLKIGIYKHSYTHAHTWWNLCRLSHYFTARSCGIKIVSLIHKSHYMCDLHHVQHSHPRLAGKRHSKKKFFASKNYLYLILGQNLLYLSILLDISMLIWI